MVCPKCGQTADGDADAEAIEDWGHCLGCDHIDGESGGAEKEEGRTLT